ncbi:hypothetical protein R0137_06480 [Congregibacter brevis]|uniref:Uncharacterized protein n=1 Tax=Congregibacter brevis TaxID=3081201 RepID=A0ABZ0IGP1_9GAMM|nr:hypothetical protein R0137_06480 [Congregibacter sp. IMCC45268]
MVAAKRFFRRGLSWHDGEPTSIVTDKSRSSGIAHRDLMPEASTVLNTMRITGRSS